MAKNIGKLAAEESVIMEDVRDAVSRIKNQISFEKSSPSARKKLRVRQIISGYINLTRHYQEKYGLDFEDENRMMREKINGERYKPEDFGL